SYYAADLHRGAALATCNRDWCSQEQYSQDRRRVAEAHIERLRDLPSPKWPLTPKRREIFSWFSPILATFDRFENSADRAKRPSSHFRRRRARQAHTQPQALVMVGSN